MTVKIITRAAIGVRQGGRAGSKHFLRGTIEICPPMRKIPRIILYDEKMGGTVKQFLLVYLFINAKAVCARAWKISLKTNNGTDVPRVILYAICENHKFDKERKGSTRVNRLKEKKRNRFITYTLMRIRIYNWLFRNIEA